MKWSCNLSMAVVVSGVPFDLGTQHSPHLCRQCEELLPGDKRERERGRERGREGGREGAVDM